VRTSVRDPSFGLLLLYHPSERLNDDTVELTDRHRAGGLDF
jgi:hypothetical protein